MRLSLVQPDAARDAAFMRQALALARRGLGETWPNPSVGAVVVSLRDGAPVIVGRGRTAPGGRPHAEAVALDRAGLAAVGATLYVTLEPCAYRSVRGGQPCTERTLLSGIGRVVSAMADPNPRIAGLGHALLRTAGVRVDVGVLGAEAQALQAGHVSRVLKGRPHLTFKIARTADGYAGGPGGTRLAVSGPQANDWVHLARAHADAIMVGVDTVLGDDPQLTVRLPGLGHRSPVRVVLDSRLRSHPALTLVRTARETPTWIMAAEDAPAAAEVALVAAGVEVMRVARGVDGHLDLAAALELLALRGITRVFSEGGPTVGEQLALQGLADEVIVSTGPERLDRPGVVAVRPALAAELAAGLRWRKVATRAVGRDRFDHYERMA